jgi:hypothetical protein
MQYDLATGWLLFGDTKQSAAAIRRAAQLGYFADAKKRQRFDTDDGFAAVRKLLTDADYLVEEKK